jgi:putative effector of murein hydrolase LrgA (UPF0299 family)
MTESDNQHRSEGASQGDNFWHTLRQFALVMGIFLLPSAIRSLGSELDASWLTLRPVSNGCGTLLAFLVSLLIPPIRGVVAGTLLRYIFLGLGEALLYTVFTWLTIDAEGHSNGLLPPVVAFCLFLFAASSWALVLYWDDARARKRLLYASVLCTATLLVAAVFKI